MKLNFSLFHDEEIKSIASCVDKIDELTLGIAGYDASNITNCGWVILSTAISNRPTSVRKHTEKILSLNSIYNILVNYQFLMVCLKG